MVGPCIPDLAYRLPPTPPFVNHNPIKLPVFDAEEAQFLISALVPGNQPLDDGVETRRKMCQEINCSNYAQSKNRCKRHGGGARCRVPECDKSTKRKGLCHAHGGGRMCRVEKCQKASQKRGLCIEHGGADTCIIEGCSNVSRLAQFCRKHSVGESL